MNPSVQRSWNRTLASGSPARSEEHTSELQSQSNLVCRLLLEKKKIKQQYALSVNFLKRPLLRDAASLRDPLHRQPHVPPPAHVQTALPRHADPGVYTFHSPLP